ncbi:hypothetical protein DSECCO2_659710 [anaerobic digester metagenome]
MRHRCSYPLFVKNGEGLPPVSLTGKNSISEPEINLFSANSYALHLLNCCRNCLFYSHPIQKSGVAHNTLLCIKTLLRNIASLNKRYHGEVKMSGKGIVSAVMGRNSHDCTSAIARKYILGNPNRYFFICKWIYGITAAENTCHSLALCHSLPFSLLFSGSKV